MTGWKTESSGLPDRTLFRDTGRCGYTLDLCVSRNAAPVSHQKRLNRTVTNAIEPKRKRSKINKAARYPVAHNGLVAGSILLAHKRDQLGVGSRRGSPHQTKLDLMNLISRSGVALAQLVRFPLHGNRICDAKPPTLFSAAVSVLIKRAADARHHSNCGSGSTE